MPNLNINSETLLLAFVGVTAFAFLLQALILMGILFAVRKGTRAIQQEMEDLRGSVTPLIDTAQGLLKRIGPKVEATVESSHQLITRISPKVEATMGDLADVAHHLRDEAEKVQGLAQEIVEKVRTQSSRIDAMVTSLLDGLSRAGECVADAVNRPMRQVQSFVASVKSAVESVNGAVPPRPPNPRRDQDRNA